MSDVSIEQRIIEKLRQLDDSAKMRVLEFIEHAADTREETWERRVLSESLGDALKSDGSLDFERLNASGAAMTPEDLYAEGDEDDGA